MRLRRVFDDGDAAWLRQGDQRLDVGRMAVQVHRDYRLRSRSDPFAHARWRKAEGPIIDIGEYRSRALMEHRCGGRDERVCGDDHFVSRSDAERSDGRVDCRRTGTGRDTVTGTVPGSEIVLEGGDYVPGKLRQAA